MTHLKIATTVHPFCDWNVSAGIITHALELRGYGRHITLGEPGLSKDIRIKRLKFAQEHRNRIIKQ